MLLSAFLVYGGFKVVNLKRYDNVDNSQWMTTPFERTAEGFFKGRAIVTCCGVFTYIKADGSKVRELRLPEEVFKPSTLDSLKLKPVTLNHPDVMVTPENVSKYQVGSLGEAVSRTTQERTYEGFTSWKELTDGYNVAVDMVITREDAIKEIINGKQGLSMGYTCDIEQAEPGATWCGVEYDYIQRNIRYNHCAIVDEGRAGDNAKIRLTIDSNDAILDSISIPKKTVEKTSRVDGGNTMAMKKINLDGIEFEAEESVIRAYNTVKANLDEKEKELNGVKDEMQKQVSALSAERDNQKERADKAEEELKKVQAEASDSNRIDEAVRKRLELFKNAEKAGVELKGDEKDNDIKKLIILKVYPKANLDGKDDYYIDARYDGAVETLAEQTDNAVKTTLASATTNSDSVDDARSRMIERMKKQSRNED